MTDNPDNTNKLEDEELDQVTGGTLRIEASDYLAEINLITTVYVSDTDIIKKIEAGYCPSCKNNTIEKLTVSYCCRPCETCYIIVTGTL